MTSPRSPSATRRWRRSRTSRSAGRRSSSIQPRTVDELRAVLARVPEAEGAGADARRRLQPLIRDDPVPGAVVRLDRARLHHDRVGRQAHHRRRRRAALRPHRLLGAPGPERARNARRLRGTVGGSVRCNVGDRAGEIGQAVRQVTVLTDTGKMQVRTRDELTFTEHQSDIDEPVILSVDFELEKDSPGRGAEADAEGVDPAQGRRTAQLPGRGAAVPQPAGADRRDAHRPRSDDQGQGRRRGTERAELELRRRPPRHHRHGHPATGRSGPRAGQGTHRGQPRTRTCTSGDSSMPSPRKDDATAGGNALLGETRDRLSRDARGDCGRGLGHPVAGRGSAARDRPARSLLNPSSATSSAMPRRDPSARSSSSEVELPVEVPVAVPVARPRPRSRSSRPRSRRIRGSQLSRTCPSNRRTGSGSSCGSASRCSRCGSPGPRSGSRGGYNGVLLPSDRHRGTADAAHSGASRRQRLPVNHGPMTAVKRAVELVEAHHPKALEKTPQGWRLTMSDGKVLVVEK